MKDVSASIKAIPLQITNRSNAAVNYYHLYWHARKSFNKTADALKRSENTTNEVPHLNALSNYYTQFKE